MWPFGFADPSEFGPRVKEVAHLCSTQWIYNFYNN